MSAAAVKRGSMLLSTNTTLTHSSVSGYTVVESFSKFVIRSCSQAVLPNMPISSVAQSLFAFFNYTEILVLSTVFEVV